MPRLNEFYMQTRLSVCADGANAQDPKILLDFPYKKRTQNLEKILFSEENINGGEKQSEN